MMMMIPVEKIRYSFMKVKRPRHSLIFSATLNDPRTTASSHLRPSSQGAPVHRGHSSFRGSSLPFSTFPGKNLTPSEAGKAAFDLRNQLERKKSEDGAGAGEQWRTSMSTMLSHAGLPTHSPTKKDQGQNFNSPLSPPIELATTYERPPDGNYGENGLIYSRSLNPTRKLLEDAMGELEIAPCQTIHGEAVDDEGGASSNVGNGANVISEPAPTCAFSSGMAAVASLLLAHPSPVKLLIPRDVYHGVPTQLITSLNDHGIVHEALDMTNIDEIREKIIEDSTESTNLIVWMETPSNPLCQVTDIQKVCHVVNERRGQVGDAKITTVVDSTWAPPCITQPLLLGADAVLHSGTKYLGGHSDVLLGVISCSPYASTGKWLGERLKAVQSSVGAVASPLESWLTLRGLRTLHLRVQRQCETAMKLAQFLNGHELVVKCHYPGLESHPQHDAANRQMKRKKRDGSIENLYGGMLSFEVKDEAMAMAVAGAVRIIRRATSLGGTETLIEHRASIEPPERRTSPCGLLRLSVGLEDVEDLKHDLEMALDVASSVC